MNTTAVCPRCQKRHSVYPEELPREHEGLTGSHVSVFCPACVAKIEGKLVPFGQDDGVEDYPESE